MPKKEIKKTKIKREKTEKPVINKTVSIEGESTERILPSENESTERILFSENKSSRLRGLVVMAKTAKTVTVLIESHKTHPLYKKSYVRSKKYLVHDEIGVLLGDVVEIMQTKPISKNKHFKVVRVIGKNIAAIVSEEIQAQTEEQIEAVLPEEKADIVELVESSEQVVTKNEEKKKPVKKTVKKEDSK